MCRLQTLIAANFARLSTSVRKSCISRLPFARRVAPKVKMQFVKTERPPAATYLLLEKLCISFTNKRPLACRTDTRCVRFLMTRRRGVNLQNLSLVSRGVLVLSVPRWPTWVGAIDDRRVCRCNYERRDRQLELRSYKTIRKQIKLVNEQRGSRDGRVFCVSALGEVREEASRGRRAL
ncbi:hypothetical protein EVAR_61983_1 [Eumeta japonica]|uniref:Uncharacterized protein n=1 Tax=Eumeta variegata TaxID=151549 RepID=A0A4C1YEF0_EUMVA|nr:hypothetical protein EVAR_61983_1 [Eumeta japonica]